MWRKIISSKLNIVSYVYTVLSTFKKSPLANCEWWVNEVTLMQKIISSELTPVSDVENITFGKLWMIGEVVATSSRHSSGLKNRKMNWKLWIFTQVAWQMKILNWRIEIVTAVAWKRKNWKIGLSLQWAEKWELWLVVRNCIRYYLVLTMYTLFFVCCSKLA